MCKTIHLFRHGKTVWNDEGRLQGWLDSPLVVRPTRSNIHVDYVAASDLGRAVQTAQALFPSHVVHTDRRLREIHLGHWQGQYIAQLQQDTAYVCYAQTPQLFQPTTQESFTQVTARMTEALYALFALPHKSIAVVSHGIAIACVRCVIDGKSFQHVHDYMLEGAQSITLTEQHMLHIV